MWFKHPILSAKYLSKPMVFSGKMIKNDFYRQNRLFTQQCTLFNIISITKRMNIVVQQCSRAKVDQNGTKKVQNRAKRVLSTATLMHSSLRMYVLAYTLTPSKLQDV